MAQTAVSSKILSAPRSEWRAPAVWRRLYADAIWLQHLLTEELRLRPGRLRTSVRMAFIGAVGAALMAALHVNSGLGPYTLWIALYASNALMTASAGLALVLADAALLSAAVPIVGILVEAPWLLLPFFGLVTALITYGRSKRGLGGAWLAVEITFLHTFYLCVFDPHDFGWSVAYTFAGVALAVGVLVAFDMVLWPAPAEPALLRSLATTLHRQCERLATIGRAYLDPLAVTVLPEPAVVSMLPTHLPLLERARRELDDPQRAAVLLAAVTTTERLHIEIERLLAIARDPVPQDIRGRLRPEMDAALQALAAANFAFNRELQTVVFTTQRAFYALAAAKAGVTAAEQTLKLTKTDHDVAQHRVSLGLATQPELLLSRARVAQAEYDLANAQLFVQQGQANLALAIGVAANASFDIESLQSQQVSQSFGREVEQLIAEALRRRPDLAAQVATLNARQAGVDWARAMFYPTVDALASYGEQLWNFQFGGPLTQKPIQPQYTGQLTLNWELFTGFARLNQLRQAEAERAAAAAALQAGELSATAEVWRAYYEFVSTQKKYAYAQALLTASQESYAANLDTYTQGLSTIVELLTAERDLANARFTLIQSMADVLTASAAVAYAMGAIEAPRRP